MKYDLCDMPARHRTFMRLRYVAADGQSRAVRHALHVQFATSQRGAVYVYSDIRVLFTPRSDDSHLTMECKHPDKPRYTPLPASVEC